MIIKTFTFNLQNWITNKFNESEMDKYQDFINTLYSYEESHHYDDVTKKDLLKLVYAIKNQKEEK